MGVSYSFCPSVSDIWDADFRVCRVPAIWIGMFSGRWDVRTVARVLANPITISTARYTPMRTLFETRPWGLLIWHRHWKAFIDHYFMYCGNNLLRSQRCGRRLWSNLRWRKSHVFQLIAGLYNTISNWTGSQWVLSNCPVLKVKFTCRKKNRIAKKNILAKTVTLARFAVMIDVICVGSKERVVWKSRRTLGKHKVSICLDFRSNPRQHHFSILYWFSNIPRSQAAKIYSKSTLKVDSRDFLLRSDHY